MKPPRFKKNAITSGSDHCILLVENDDIITALIKEILKDEGYRIISARTTGTVYDILHTFNPQLFLVDYWLSGSETGVDLIRWLREEKEYENTPIVFLSAEDEILQKVQRISRIMTLNKPFNIQNLVDIVRKAFALI